MASLTNLLKLIKPDKSENYSVDVWNANSDTIDEAVGKRVVKNDDIVPKTATKITYDAKGLVTGGAELDPDDIPNLDISKITGRAPVIYVDGVPIYGSRFVDIDDSGNMVLKADGSGDWLISVTEDGKVLVTRAVTPIADDLVTSDAETALSAKMGKYLKQLVDTITTAFNTFTARTDNPHNVTKAQVGLGSVDNTADLDKPVSTAVEARLMALDGTLSTHSGKTDNPHKVTKAQVGLGNADNTADADKNVATAKKLATARKINGVAFDGSKDITVADSTKIPTTQKGTVNGVAELDANGKVPSSQLPSYVDDVIEGYYHNDKFYKEAAHTTEITGEDGKIYVSVDTDLTYRWSGTKFVEISQSLALGETSSTAYPGNKGKANATDIATLKTTTAKHTTDITKLNTDTEALRTDLTAVEESTTELKSGKADLIGGKVPDTQLPYYNSSPTIFIDDKPIYPITFADVKDGKAVISDDGNGEYLVACTPDGTVYLRNMTNNVTDPVTGVVYRLDIVNNQPQLTKI